jgi:hypothetical protein
MKSYIDIKCLFDVIYFWNKVITSNFWNFFFPVWSTRTFLWVIWSQWKLVFWTQHIKLHMYSNFGEDQTTIRATSRPTFLQVMWNLVHLNHIIIMTFNLWSLGKYGSPWKVTLCVTIWNFFFLTLNFFFFFLFFFF